MRGRVFFGFLAALVLARSPGAHAYEPATTLAGLTEQAALASRLHQVLAERFGRDNGLLDLVRLHLVLLPEPRARDLRVRLLALDPAEGYAPEDTAERPLAMRAPERQSAIGWLMAGTVIESVPAWRERHHFLDPATGQGLHGRAGQSALGVRFAAVGQGVSSVRNLFTGTAFDGTGRPATEWLEAADNDLSLREFRRAYEQAVLLPERAERDTALVQLLLCAGAALNLLEAAGDPAQVHNRFDLLREGRYQRFVARRYGRAGIPAPAETVAGQPAQPLPRSFRDLVLGLAHRTARFPASALRDERRYPALAAALLPEIGRYAARALDLLFRGELHLEPDDDELRVSADLPLGPGTLTLLGEDRYGRRRPLRSAALGAGPAGTELLRISAAERRDHRRLALLFRGADDAGEPLLLSAELRSAQPVAPQKEDAP